MTIRLDENNIIDFLHNFNEKHIRESKHSNYRSKHRKILFQRVRKLLTQEFPIYIKQQGTKKFALRYHYHEEYYIFIVIAVKDKFINMVTQYLFKRSNKKELLK